MTILENAQTFVSNGISVLPVGYKDKRPDFHLIHAWEYLKTTLPDYTTLLSWFGRGEHNYGIVAGWNNLVIIDFDDMPEFRAWSRWAMQTGGMAQYVNQNAYRVASSRGMHVYIRLPHKERNRKVGTKIDIKADGYVLGAGSVHPTGVLYRSLRERLHFPLVSALSDVLPASMLITTHQTIPAAIHWPTQVMPPGNPGAGLVERIKKNIPIESLFSNVQPSGTSYVMTNCPLHDDKHPSMWINTKEQICGCFAGCSDKPMDVINLTARLHGLSNRDAIFFLAEKL